MDQTKFCKFCGEKIPIDAVICTKCGRQVEEIKSKEPQIVVNNNNTNNNVPFYPNNLKPKNKVVSLLLCLFLGCFGAHKFYEGKIGMGVLYLFTGGLFFIGVIIDFITLLFKPNTYYL